MIMGQACGTAACMAIEPILVALRHRRVRRELAAEEERR